MKKVVSLGNVYVMQSRIADAGRGVFARRNIKKDEIIEKCPVIEIPKHDMANLRESVLVTYFFFHGKDKEQVLLALGDGSIYNHANKPNAIYKIKDKDMTIDFIALRDIKKDDEITFDYYGSSKNKDPLWFVTK